VLNEAPPGGTAVTVPERARGVDARGAAPAEEGETPRASAADALCLVLVLVVAGALRFVHIDATSLWWDEIVHVQTSALPSFGEVLSRVRLGDPPGLGNAGAVPIDYLLLHAYLSSVPPFAPERLELYYRLPSWLFSTLAVGALFLYARRFFGRTSALAAALLLATSVPHALYAGEARFYSLFTFLTVLLLWSFSYVAREPRSPRAWLVHAATGLCTVLTGLLGGLLLVGQYAVLAVLLGRSPSSARTAPGGVRAASLERRGRVSLPLFAPLASAAGIALVLIAYYRVTHVLAGLHRANEDVGSWDAITTVFSFFALESPVLLALFLLSIPLVWTIAARQDRARLAIVAHVTTSFLWIPILAELAAWKGYYVRPRHALFLMPYFALVTGLGVATALRLLDPFRRLPERRRALAGVAAAVAIVVLAQAGAVVGYLGEPLRYADRIKPTRDVKALAQHLAERAAAMPQGHVYLLVGDQRRPGYLVNPEIAWYLNQYGVSDRVLLRTVEDPGLALDRLEAVCAADCSGRLGPAFALVLDLSPKLDVRASIRELLGIHMPILLPPRTVEAIGIARYRFDRRRPPSKLSQRVIVRRGWQLFETDIPAPGAADRS
jgi:hypothetical protein